jgi:hypothetical protein
MEQAYAAVGRAIVAAQIFETALVPIFELHRVHTEPDRLSETKGYLSAGAFKMPVTNIVKFLSSRGSIAPDLEARLHSYIQDRHLLVHRWLHENPLPLESEPETMLPLMEHAQKVEREATDLARLIVGYVVKYAEPEWAASNPEDFSAKMAALFRGAHRQP